MKAFRGPDTTRAQDGRRYPLLEFTTDLVIVAPPTKVLEAFFDSKALAAWWRAKQSVCVPRPLGSYAIEWEPTEWRDEILGRLGGALHATVMEFKPGREFFLADTYWLPPDGDPIGPMALEVTCNRHTWGTQLHVRQSGYEEGVRWRRYYELSGPGWHRALESLKRFVERGRLD
jgi:uncharacterized protein YndB with AHSA1/START domain